MKQIIDNFSKQSESYKKFRPEYPDELYQLILSHTTNRDSCWDCGTGNGQVAKELSKYFKEVYATDISKNQIELAEQKPNIEYSITRAEHTNFTENQFDMITVAQAIHWFDFQKFYQEVRRVGKPNSKLFVWGYGLLKIDSEIDKIIDEFYFETIHSYWNLERKHIENEYQMIEFDFQKIEVNTNLNIRTHWTQNQLIGYLNSWSSVQNYIKQNQGKNPVHQIEERLIKTWKDDEVKPVRFPIFMKIGLIEK